MHLCSTNKQEVERWTKAAVGLKSISWQPIGLSHTLQQGRWTYSSKKKKLIKSIRFSQKEKFLIFKNKISDPFFFWEEIALILIYH